ncbi:WD40-repeat-containing domain protein [Scleroderma yunnanense]
MEPSGPEYSLNNAPTIGLLIKPTIPILPSHQRLNYSGMTNDQPKIRRSKLKPQKTNPLQGITDPQFILVCNLSLSGDPLGYLTGQKPQESSPALAPDIPSNSRGLSNIAKGKLASLKKLLPFSRSKNMASSSISPPNPQGESTQVAPVNEPQEPTRKVDQPVTCDEVNAAQNELGTMIPVPLAAQHAVGVVGAINTTISQIDTISVTYLKPLRSFTTVVSSISNIHPYTQMALGVLTSAAQLITTQANLDNSVSGLLEKIRIVYKFLLEEDTQANLDTMKVTLARIAQVISNCTQFIKNYSETKNFSSIISGKRLGKNIASETQTAIDDYNKALDDLMQQYRDRIVHDTHTSVYRVLEDLNLDGMAYAGGAGLNTTKRCLDGTRMEILKEIVDWIHDPDVDAPRIFWLHGQAGRGKSAIAHTIALWFKNAGGLGSCFCFARDRQSERREEKMLSTIARDLADRDPAFRRALAKAIEQDNTLKTTPDVMQQWEKLFLEPLSKVSGGIVGNVVVVIDALDESGLDISRTHILSALTSTEAASLPSNFRILLTSRPLSDIMVALRGAQHVKATSLDNIPFVLAERDIRLYVSNKLNGLGDIGKREIEYITLKADGLFEWARLACDFIKPRFAGQMAEERFDELIAHASGEGTTLLDSMYSAILGSAVGRTPRSLARFRSLMLQILRTLEPLPMDALHAMRKCFPHEEDRYDVAIVLDYMGSLLSGIADHTQPIRPLHASFHDFLTDQSRSGDYFVGESDIEADLAVASLHILRGGLCFNICGLESSYLLNSEVPGLAERIEDKIPSHLSYSCQFWANHLHITKFDHVLAGHVKDILGNERILFWFEALSLLGVLHDAVFALLRVERWLRGQEGYKDVVALARDGIKFIHTFCTASSASTPHLYISALPFIPENSVLCGTLKTRFACIAQVAEGHHKEWPAVQDVFEGHTNSVISVAFSSDGTRIVSGSDDMTVRVWDADRGVQIGSPLEGHTDLVTSVAFSPDGTRIVSGSYDKTVRVWDVDRGVQIGSPLEGHTDLVTSVAFSPDGIRIVSGSYDKTVRVWDTDRGVQIDSPLEGHTDWITSVAFSPDGTRIVSGSSDKTVRVWDVDRGVQIGSPLEGHTDLVTSVAFSPDGTRIVSGSSDKTVRVWDVDRGVQIGSPLEGHTHWVTSVVFSPDGIRIVSGSSDKTVRVWDVDRGVQIGSSLEGHTNLVRSVAFSPDGTRIVSGSSDKTVRVWDVDRGVQIDSPVEGHTDLVTSVAFSPDGTRIVSGSSDKTVRVWDVDRGVQIGSSLEGHTHRVRSVAFSPDGTRIVSSSSDKTVRVWDVDRGVQIGSSLEGHTSLVRSVVFSPDGTRIVSGSYDKTVRVWDVDRGVQIGSSLEGHTDWVTSVAFSPDGTRIVSSSSDKTVRVWDADRGVQIGSSLEGHTDWVRSVVFSPDGTRIVSGSSDKTVRVWDVDRGVQIGSPLEGHTDCVRSVAFSLDGTRIVSGSSDKTVRVWDVDRGVQIGSPLEGHTDWVRSVAFSPDGTRIVSGSSDKTVRVWDVDRGVQIGSPPKGLTDCVTSVAFSPNGPRTVSDSDDKTVLVCPAGQAMRIEGNASCCSNEEYITASNGESIIHLNNIFYI